MLIKSVNTHAIAHGTANSARLLSKTRYSPLHTITQLMQKISEVFNQAIILITKTISQAVTSFNEAQRQKALFIQSINAWAKQGEATEDRKEAAKLIIHAYTWGSRSLDLYSLNLRSLPPEIGNLTQLRELTLFNNQLAHLPPEIGNLTQLTYLDLYSLNLRSLPAEIGNLSKLRKLNLRYNQLTHLPPEIGNLTQLRKLNLSNNQLTHLPPEFGNLTQLTELYLKGNQLRALPSEIGNLGQLKWLYLGNNQLTDLPPEICNLTQLTGLELFNNQLTHLPPEIGNLTQLTILSLWNNQLRALPKEIGNLTQLTVLELGHTPITNDRTSFEIIAAYPFLLKIPARESCLYAQNLQTICQINGLALEFIPDNKKTTQLISIAINQNPASISFVPQELITYDLAKLAVSLDPIVTWNCIPQEHLTDELVSIAIHANPQCIAFIPPSFHHLISFDIAKRAVVIDPAFAKFIPDEVIDVHSLLSQLETNHDLLKDEPYLLSLLIKVGALDKISDTMYEDAIAHDYRLLGCMPLEIQNSSLGDNLITYALRQNPKAYYMIEPAFFNEKMLTTMIQDCQYHHDLEPVLRHIISKMNTQDEALVLRMSDLAYPLSQYFHDDKEVLLMLISKYGITLEDLSDDLKADYDIVFNAIHNQPDDIKFSLVSKGNGQKDLMAYAQERKIKLKTIISFM